MTAHRAALDHVLTLIAESPWAEQLVLRGSMTMPAWVGAAARPPGDLDWLVRKPEVTLLDDLDPYPFVDRLVPVQQWPEAAHGAIRNEIWEFEEFDTGGRRASLPPEGLHWIPGSGFDSFDEELWDQEFTGLIRKNPHTPEGIEFGAEIDFTRDWDYAEYEPGGENGRVRLRLPWRAPDGTGGEVQVDLAFGEALPEVPVCTAVPRSGGRPPLGLWTAGRELSLAWKLHWLAADQQTNGVSAWKDLYDAVLLAELPEIHLSPRLRRVAVGRDPTLRRAAVDLDPTLRRAAVDLDPTLRRAAVDLDPTLRRAAVDLDPAGPPPSPSPSPEARGPGSLEHLLTPDKIRRWAISRLPLRDGLSGSDSPSLSKDSPRADLDAPMMGDPAAWLSRLADAVSHVL
ncbi:nucleotidyl transferase AbiEii/AbiGii toxin family protein [Actinoplanes philippinensis]|uniref:nucleotidyl transferase AbiEii/AbiGii toxin family protein n=1 Tax=Actinoplanes philippinensis TaxID=35752 RepID=UPI0033D49D1D